MGELRGPGYSTRNDRRHELRRLAPELLAGGRHDRSGHRRFLRVAEPGFGRVWFRATEGDDSRGARLFAGRSYRKALFGRKRFFERHVPKRRAPRRLAKAKEAERRAD